MNCDCFHFGGSSLTMCWSLFSAWRGQFLLFVLCEIVPFVGNSQSRPSFLLLPHSFASQWTQFVAVTHFSITSIALSECHECHNSMGKDGSVCSQSDTIVVSLSIRIRLKPDAVYGMMPSLRITSQSSLKYFATLTSRSRIVDWTMNII